MRLGYTVRSNQQFFQVGADVANHQYIFFEKCLYKMGACDIFLVGKNTPAIFSFFNLMKVSH